MVHGDGITRLLLLLLNYMHQSFLHFELFLYVLIFFSIHFRDHDLCLTLTGEYMSPGICKYTNKC